MTFSINQQQVHFITDQSVFFVQNLQYGMFRKISSVKAPRVLYKNNYIIIYFLIATFVLIKKNVCNLYFRLVTNYL